MDTLETKFGVVAPEAQAQQEWFDARMDILRRRRNGESLRSIAISTGRSHNAVAQQIDKATRDLEKLGMQPDEVISK